MDSCQSFLEHRIGWIQTISEIVPESMITDAGK